MGELVINGRRFEVRKMGIYRKGYRYCKVDQLWFKTRRTRCPLCNRLLRYKTRRKRLMQRVYTDLG